MFGSRGFIEVSLGDNSPPYTSHRSLRSSLWSTLPTSDTMLVLTDTDMDTDTDTNMMVVKLVARLLFLVLLCTTVYLS